MSSLTKHNGISFGILSLISNSHRCHRLAQQALSEQSLAEAKSAAQRLLARIRFLERRKFASSSPRHIESDAKALARQQCVICSDMRQFSFA